MGNLNWEKTQRHGDLNLNPIWEKIQRHGHPRNPNWEKILQHGHHLNLNWAKIQRPGDLNRNPNWAKIQRPGAPHKRKNPFSEEAVLAHDGPGTQTWKNQLE